jgi:hypothetical protein
MVKRLFIVACLTCAAMPARVSASCMQPGTICEELAKADLAFVAVVLGATHIPDRDDQGRPYPRGVTTYRFNVLEGLKGIQAGEFSADFYFNPGGDLDTFHTGRRYVIFAKRAATGIYLSGCSLTREITKIGEIEWWPAMHAELRACLKKP